MEKQANIIESVEFLAADELLVSELDKRLTFTAIPELKTCIGVSVCGCLVNVCDCHVHRPVSVPSAVRG